MSETTSFSRTIACESLELPRKPLLSSDGANWRGIRLEYQQQPPYTVPEHIADHHEIRISLFQHSQRIRLNLDGRAQNQQSFTKGDIAIVPAQMAHSCAWESDIEIIMLDLAPSLLAHTAYESIHPDRIELIPTVAQSDPLVYQLGMNLKTVLETDGSRSCLYAESVAAMLSAHLLQHYCVEKTVIQDYVNELPKYKLNHVIDYIQASLDRNLSLVTLAFEVSLSPYHFSRLFKQSVGVSVHQYVIRCRIERTKALLLQGQLSVTEIAFEVGFANPSHLSHHFKRIVGVTPKKFVNS
jgi:AraC family transcriptional regulator